MQRSSLTSMSSKIPLPKSSVINNGDLLLKENPVTSLNQKPQVEENLMKMANKLPEISKKDIEKEFIGRDMPINTSLSRVKSSNTTAEFSTHEGVLKNQDIEKALLEKGFIPTEKILTKDKDDIICRFIKARDNLGHILYVELDTTEKDCMGYVSISQDDLDNLMTVSSDASVIPYALKVGSFEASSSSLFGVGFECDNQICVMSRKDNSLQPVQTVFTLSRSSNGQDMGIQDKHPIPFPVVKLSEILFNPQTVAQNVATAHSRMREVAFKSCTKDIAFMNKNLGELQHEIERFNQLSSSVSQELKETISKLEKMYSDYTCRGSKCSEDNEKLKSIKFNLNVRHNLQNDFTSLCHSMRERAQKIAVLNDEIKSLNDFAENLFKGLKYVFTE